MIPVIRLSGNENTIEVSTSQAWQLMVVVLSTQEAEAGGLFVRLKLA